MDDSYPVSGTYLQNILFQIWYSLPDHDLSKYTFKHKYRHKYNNYYKFKYKLKKFKHEGRTFVCLILFSAEYLTQI